MKEKILKWYLGEVDDERQWGGIPSEIGGVIKFGTSLMLLGLILQLFLMLVNFKLHGLFLFLFLWGMSIRRIGIERTFRGYPNVEPSDILKIIFSAFVVGILSLALSKI